MIERADQRTSSSGRWFQQRRLKIALGIAAVEGLLAALANDFTQWTAIAIAIPIIGFYLFAGRSLASHAWRELAWIAAASQAFVVILVILSKVIGLLALLLVGVFAAVAIYLILTDRPVPGARS